MKRIVFAFLALSLSLNSFAANLTRLYKEQYRKANSLGMMSIKALKSLKGSRIILIPGLLSESFRAEDDRSSVDFSLITNGYFQSQLEMLEEKYGLDAVQILSSSSSLDQIKGSIDEEVKKAKQDQKSLVFVAHSLGGLALVDYLVDRPEAMEIIKGNLIMQSPLYGTPIANLYQEDPYYIGTALKPILPYVNVSEDVFNLMRTDSREHYMNQNKDRVSKIVSNVKTLTFAGYIGGARSTLKATYNVMRYGCLVASFNRCWSKKVYRGSYAENDGLVPLESTKLPGANFVAIKRVDHVETVINVPFSDADKNMTLEALLNVLLTAD
jgi:hypothetical protein